MSLIHLLANPLFHLSLLIIMAALTRFAFADTPTNNCPSNQFMVSSWANIGLGCSAIDYSQLTGKPTIPAAQVNSDWNASSGVSQILNKPTVFTSCYDGSTKRNNCFVVSSQATVASGSAVYQETTDGTSTGTALCTNGIIANSIQPVALDATLPYEYGTPVISNSNRTITIPVNRSSGVLTVLTLNVLGAPAAANGSVVNMTALCY